MFPVSTLTDALFKPSDWLYEASEPVFEPSDTTYEPSDATFRPSECPYEPLDTTFRPSDATCEPSDTTLRPSVPIGGHAIPIMGHADSTYRPSEATFSASDSIFKLSGCSHAASVRVCNSAEVFGEATGAVYEGAGRPGYSIPLPPTRARVPEGRVRKSYPVQGAPGRREASEAAAGVRIPGRSVRAERTGLSQRNNRNGRNPAAPPVDRELF